MPTLIYSPAVTARIATADGTIYDVSADISDFAVSRELGISNASLTLTNANRKYDGVFTSMDRIVIYQRRFTTLLTFSGYLDQTPVFSTYTKSVSLRASCSAKRLQHFHWDPTTGASVALMTPDNQTKNREITDGGVSERAVRLLNKVAGWPREQIHIGAIPNTWMQKVSTVAEKLSKEADVASAVAALGADAMIYGNNPATGSRVEIPGSGVGTGRLPDYQGKASQFGGPSGGAYGNMALTGEPGGLPDNARAKWGGPYYCAMRWPYFVYNRDGDLQVAHGANVSKAAGWWKNRKILVVSKDTGRAVVVRAADWGPGSGGNRALASADTRIIDLSETAMKALGIHTDQNVAVAFADDDAKLGPVDVSTGAKINSDSSLKSGLSEAANPAVTDGTAKSALKFLSVAEDTILKGRPRYVFGASASTSDPYPPAFDCSELVQWAAFRSGFGHALDGTAYTQYLNCKPISVDEARRTKGALLFMTSGGLSNAAVHHVAISRGDGTTIEARSTAKGTGIFDAKISAFNLAGLIRGMDYSNAAGPGTGGVVPGSTSTTPGEESVDIKAEVGEALINAFDWLGSTNFGGDLLTGVRALMNDVPIYGAFDDLMSTGLRHWCTAPNGDIIGWFPDYFGHYGTAAKMVIQDIEIEEPFTVSQSDDRLKTHMFVTSASTGFEGYGDASTVYQQTGTAGIASVEFPELMAALFNVNKSAFADGGKAFLNRYGARPDNHAMDNITGHKQEFYFACFRFMQNWSDQWSCQVRLTYMPEIYPGMLLVFPRFGLQAYVQAARHTGSPGTDGGGFRTEVTLTAWSTVGRQSAVKGLPVGAPL